MLRGPADEGGEVLVGKARADNQDGHAVFRVVLCGRAGQRVRRVTQRLKARALQSGLHRNNQALAILLHLVGPHAYGPRQPRCLLVLLAFTVFLGQQEGEACFAIHAASCSLVDT